MKTLSPRIGHTNSDYHSSKPFSVRKEGGLRQLVLGDLSIKVGLVKPCVILAKALNPPLKLEVKMWVRRCRELSLYQLLGD